FEAGCAGAVDVEDTVLHDRRGFHLERQATDPPETLTRREGIGRQVERAGYEQLWRSPGGRVHNRRRMSGVRFRAIDLPSHASSGPIERNHEGTVALVADQD